MRPRVQAADTRRSVRSNCLTGEEAPAAAELERQAERRLLERCLANDKQAWDALVKKYELSVFRFAYSLCRNRDDAADIAGYVFVRVFEHLDTYRHEACFTSWLFRIVRNAYTDICLRPAYRSCVSLDADTDPDNGMRQPSMREVADDRPSPEDQSINNEVARQLKLAVKRLPRYQREVLTMCHLDGKSYEEIATATGISIGTVKSRLSRARASLRERLSPFQSLFVTN